MFDKTWKWAGKFRKTGKNIGVDDYRIEFELQQLLDGLFIKYIINHMNLMRLLHVSIN
jgi:fido (protein-threonine AMPylation protein)